MDRNIALLRPEVVSSVNELSVQFAKAEPFRHLVIDQFLKPEVAKRLLQEFPAFERGDTVGDDGQQGGKSTFEKIRALGPTFAALDEMIQSEAWLSWLGTVTGIDGLLYDPFYLGGGTHENRDGQALDSHIDFNLHPSERWHRRLNLIIYLNHDWSPAWGGNLQLLRDPYQDSRPDHQISPEFNRCVVFETNERSWHGFDRLQLPESERARSRRSIALYFYSKDRPQAEQAPKHSTHYVSAQLPDRFKPGYCLNADDVAQLASLISERDAHLQRLYAENSRLLHAQEQGLSGQVLYLMKRAFVRFRRFR